MEDYRFVIDRPAEVDESRYYEFKEIKGGKPVDTIKNACDEYVVAFLNSSGGRIFWGVRNSDRIPVGVSLSFAQRDELRKIVTNKLHQIKPPISPAAYQINLHPLYEDDTYQKAVDDKYVVEIVAPSVLSNDLYSTGSGQVFVKTDSGKKLLSFQEVQDEIRRRQIQKRDSSLSSIPQLSTIQNHSLEFSLTSEASSRNRDSLMREISRMINRSIVTAFLDAVYVGGPAQFVYLLSLTWREDPTLDEVIIRIELQCHITSFVHAFAQRLDSLAGGSSNPGRNYSEDLRIRAACKWSEHVPYRVFMSGPLQVEVTCLERPFYSLKFSMQTSDLLIVVSAMLTGKIIVQDDLQLSDPTQKSFVLWMSEVMKTHSFSIQDIALNVADPERWTIKSGGLKMS
jgi:hypothetical protein